MLIQFYFSNFRSFKDEAHFFMVADKQLHGQEESFIPIKFQGGYNLDLLPLTAIYGANASGKSNFVKALVLLKTIVTEGKIITDPFRLDDESSQKPTKFDIIFASEGDVWEYIMAIHSGEICEERLLRLVNPDDTEIVYERVFSDAGSVISIPSVKAWEAAKEVASPNTSVPFIHYYFDKQGRSSDISKLLKPAYSWFKSKLCVLKPTTGYRGFSRELTNPDYAKKYGEALYHSDVGISGVSTKEVLLSLDNLVVETSDDELKISGPREQVERLLSDYDTVQNKNGKYYGYICHLNHRTATGRTVNFTFDDESQGTRRMLDFIPMFVRDDLDITTFVVDELEQSLHPFLSRWLIQQHRNRALGNSKRQLIFTTHDISLLDDKLLRIDEIWRTQKDWTGATNIHSFAEFNGIEELKNLRSAYMNGRVGGIPHPTQF